MTIDLVLIPLKAGNNIDLVVNNIRNYSDTFLPHKFPKELIRFSITQLNEDKFGEKELVQYIKSVLSINKVIFSPPQKESEELINEIKYEERAYYNVC